MDSKDWTGRTDGTDWMLRSLIWFFRWMPPRVLYAVMGLVVPFYMLLRRKSFLAIYHYYRQGHGCGRLRAFVNVYRNHYAFGQVILDRFAVYAGRRFSLEIEGNEYYKRIAGQPGGAVFLSSHTGNFELCGYLLNSVGKHLHALVYAGEAEAVMENRRRVWAAHNVTMVPVRDDLSHLFAINAALEEGDAVCMAGDRLLGSAKSVVCPFLGRPARFRRAARRAPRRPLRHEGKRQPLPRLRAARPPDRRRGGPPPPAAHGGAGTRLCRPDGAHRQTVSTPMVQLL